MLRSLSHLRRSALLPPLLLLPVLVLGAGCGADEEETETDVATAETEETDPYASASTTAGVPVEGYLEVDPSEIEQGRYDESWRTAADSDRRLRRERGLTRTVGAGPGTGTTAAPAMDTGIRGRRPDARRAAEVPIERLRRTPAAPASRTTPAGGLAAGSTAAPGENGEPPPPSGPESFEDISPESLAGEPRFPIDPQGAGPTVLRTQWLLDRARFSPGILDGRWGKNTEKAVYWLQDALGEEPTGEMDRALFDRLSTLVGGARPVREHTVTSEDVDRDFVDSIPDDLPDQARLDCLCYQSAAEYMAERFHTTRELLEQLNPEVDLDELTAGTTLVVPDVESYLDRESAPNEVAQILISKDGFYLHALDQEGNVLYHFPSTLGSEYDPSPEGDFEVVGVAFDPEFHYQPKLFPEVPDSEEDAMLPPGANSPVGVVWIELSKPHYGIHGTAAPETIGYTTSHGCVRLTNWDAMFLANRVNPETPVTFRVGDARGNGGPAGGGDAAGSGRSPDGTSGGGSGQEEGRASGEASGRETERQPDA